MFINFLVWTLQSKKYIILDIFYKNMNKKPLNIGD